MAAYTIDIIRTQLYSAVLSDVLDVLGYRNQAMDCSIRPLSEKFVTVGYAHTVLAADTYELPKEPYKLQLEAIDALKPEQVLVATTNGSTRSALWGELLSTAAQARGAKGAVVDGLTRDSGPILNMGFPVFAAGRRPVDSLGRIDVIAYGCTIECGGVTVSPGDLIFGDQDGVVVVPQEVEEQVIQKALDKVREENLVRDALRDGMLAAEAFRKYGVL